LEVPRVEELGSRFGLVPGQWPGPDPAAGLTEAERMVAALAARGHTNRQIADTLVITISTVEQHLTRIYRKLRVQRRAELKPLLWAEPALADER
ncbi:helix-turn-helix domain-containing protein, partial [Amycolatopsis pittospori]|uniref:helix-turn-helix domain-containing protein n=1 Tax=Amycolatopsis pittospori TaxID=2749434 RepID=UPI0015F053D9